MQTRVTSWSGPGEPDELVLRQRLAQEGLSPYVWGNAPGDRYPVHSHTFYKVIYAVNGSIRFDLPQTGETLWLHGGDRLDLPPDTPHSAVVGPDGVLCLEAHR
jgi:quercetin dioxygenase-like cupin family protein